MAIITLMEFSKKYITIGEYKHYNKCRICFSSNITPVLNLGNVPPAGGFLKTLKDIKLEKFYPLEISFCNNCFLLQSTNVIEANILFKNYFYNSSAIKTLTRHFADLGKELKLISNSKKPFIVEIGCNDGVLLKQLINAGIYSIGIDPASNIVIPLIKKGMPIINDYFSEALAKKILNKNGPADIITSSNSLAHIEDMHDILRGIKILLKRDGILIFEVHYLGKILQELQYDMIYHEHQYYYSLLALKKFLEQYNMEIFDLKSIKIHGGSMRYYVQNKKLGKHTVSKNVVELIKKEKRLGFDKVKTYINFEKKISKTKNNLLKLLKNLKSNNKTIVGYGASGRSTTIINYCGLDKNYLDYIIDDASSKQDTYTPGAHFKIKSSDVLNMKHRPDYVLLFAWSFFEEIKIRHKKYLKNFGKFIIPLPKVKMVS